MRTPEQAYKHEWYVKHKRDRTSTTIKRNINRLKGYELLGNKCIACGASGTNTKLDFDHVNPKTKEFNIGNYLDLGWEQLKPEIMKCQLLCNWDSVNKCHAKKSSEELTFSKEKRDINKILKQLDQLIF